MGISIGNKSKNAKDIIVNSRNKEIGLLNCVEGTEVTVFR